MIAAGTPPVRVRRTSVISLLILSFGMVLIGCNSSRPPATQSTIVTKQVDPADDLTTSVREELRKSPDQAACRRLVDQLNATLPRLTGDRRPVALTPAERSQLEKELALQPLEIAEVTRVEFTTVDSYYLDESILFRDIARALDVDRLPPVERAVAALTWVRVNLRSVNPTGPALPPWFVAVRGTATPLERTYAFLTLLRQLDVDAALIGDAGPEGVWAVGVLADGQVYLFDPRLGLPLPGPDGKGVLTLGQARSTADPFHALAIDPKTPYDVTPDRVKRAEVLVTAPLSSVSPRMRFLQSLLPAGTVRLTTDPFAVGERFRSAVGADGPAVRLGGPPALDALPRCLFTFLPATEGGGDPSPPGQRRFERYLFEFVPFGLLPPFLQQLQGEPGSRIKLEFMARITSLIQPGQARDLILRGRFREATDQIVELQQRTKRRPISTQEMEQTTREWADAARSYYAAVSRRERGKADPTAVIGLDEMRGTMEGLWKNNRGPQAYLNYIVSDELAAQSTFLLALCKHEEAERLTRRPETAASAAPAWASAQRWWSTFLGNYPNRPETLAAKRNLAAAQSAGGKRAEARTAYEALANSDMPSLDRLSSRYLAESLK
jgi:hypothetical protein